jgi:predicted CoA-binding protein
MADDELFPGFNARLETAVHIAVVNALADLDMVNLKRREEQLEEITRKFIDAQSRAEVWQELATRRKSDIKELQEQVSELNARVVLLESVITNLKAAADE